MKFLRRIFPPRRYHHRSNGPVTINPDRAEIIHVWGTSPTKEHTMSDRNALADILMSDAIRLTDTMGRDYALAEADAILAAGYSKPRTIATYQELDALAIDAVVMSETIAYQNYGSGSWAADGRFYDTGQITLPAQLLHAPEPTR